jgi:putative CocE/NonD family hydrolase
LGAHTRLEVRAAVACAALATALASVALLVPRLTAHAPPLFTRTEVMVPMRDGVKLQTVYFVPRGRHAPLPILLTRTPYGVLQDETPFHHRAYAALEEDGYVFAIQNIRGRYRSEGQFLMQRPPRDPADPKGIDESTDAYDTVDWLVKNVPNNNGKVGISGTSYPGFLAAAALLDPHPALKCVSERAAMDDLFVNDDFHHNGALRLSYAFEYTYSLESEKDKQPDPPFETLDAYDWYLRLGALSHVDERYFHGTRPTWENLVAHPNHDAFWTARAPSAYLTHTDVPNLHVAGWYDQEDFLGPMSVYAKLEKTDRAGVNALVVGPWNHGQWGGDLGRKLGDIDWGSDTAANFREGLQRRFFAHWLHDGPEPDVHEATVFETGSNQWKKLDAWPPKDATPRRLYLHADRRASFDPPLEEDGADAFVSDPANPVPYRHRPIDATYTGPAWHTWLVEDQRFVDLRPDVLTWETEPLDTPVVIEGQVDAELFATTTGTDADWVVKLIDVQPDANPKEDEDAGDRSLRGYELMVASDILRGRFRDSLEVPSPIPAGQVVKYTVDLHTRAHAFLKGHRIMVQVQSTWFPLYDRNPQRYVDNIFLAKDSDYVKATHTVLHSRTHASAIVLPVVAGE